MSLPYAVAPSLRPRPKKRTMGKNVKKGECAVYIADLHIHSKYSRATSKELEPEQLDLWARKKGIGLVGTGDFTHPAWRAELREKLSPAEEGLYTLKGAHDGPRFVVTGEISTIYKKDGKVRKVHSLILLPGLEAAETLSRRLEAIGNLHSDGRPILGLDCRDLLEITLESCPDAVFIPAHIWTPHFSLFGAFSGFDTIQECFGDLTSHIRALETGLSSDPPMNHRCSALDGYTLVSNSDAHSPSAPSSSSPRRASTTSTATGTAPCASPRWRRRRPGACAPCAESGSPPACSTGWNSSPTGRRAMCRRAPGPLRAWCPCRR